MRVLSEKEKLILSVVQYRADEPVSESAKILGIPDSQVRRAIQKFESIGAIKRVVYINTASFGYRAYTLYVGLQGSDINARKYCRTALTEYPNLESLLELGGEYQFLGNYCAKAAGCFTDFIDQLSQNLPKTLAKRLCGERVYWEYLGVKHLCASAPAPRVIRMGEPGLLTLDELDFKILKAFSAPDGHRLTTIAQRTGIRTSTVAYRIDKLRGKGILKPTAFWINPVITGSSCFRLHIVFRSLTNETESQLLDYCRAHPHILGCVRLIGAWDFDLRVEVPNPERVGALAHEVRSLFSDLVESVSIIPVLDFVKVEHFPIPCGPDVN